MLPVLTQSYRSTTASSLHIGRLCCPILLISEQFCVPCAVSLVSFWYLFFSVDPSRGLVFGFTTFASFTLLLRTLPVFWFSGFRTYFSSFPPYWSCCCIVANASILYSLLQSFQRFFVYPLPRPTAICVLITSNHFTFLTRDVYRTGNVVLTETSSGSDRGAPLAGTEVR